jgi:hypothetical protein
MEGARLPLNADRSWPEGISAPREGDRSLIARVQLGFGSVQPALKGVDPIVRPVDGIASQPFGGRRLGAASAPSSRHSRALIPTENPDSNLDNRSTATRQEC